MSAVRERSAGPAIAVFLYICAALLAALAAGCLLLGPRYEVRRIPPQQRAQMADYDWVGVQWIERAAYAFAGCVLCAGAGYVNQRRYRRRLTKAREALR
jgi:hypothetical protein